jgi:hypothetical protein
VKLNAATGVVDTAFNAKFSGGIVRSLKMWTAPNGSPRLVVGGSMTRRLVALNPNTGADTGYFDLGIADPIPKCLDRPNLVIESRIIVARDDRLSYDSIPARFRTIDSFAGKDQNCAPICAVFALFGAIA